MSKLTHKTIGKMSVDKLFNMAYDNVKDTKYILMEIYFRLNENPKTESVAKMVRQYAESLGSVGGLILDIEHMAKVIGEKRAEKGNKK